MQAGACILERLRAVAVPFDNLVMGTTSVTHQFHEVPRSRGESRRGPSSYLHFVFRFLLGSPESLGYFFRLYLSYPAALAQLSCTHPSH